MSPIFPPWMSPRFVSWGSPEMGHERGRGQGGHASVPPRLHACICNVQKGLFVTVLYKKTRFQGVCSVLKGQGVEVHACMHGAESCRAVRFGELFRCEEFCGGALSTLHAVKCACSAGLR
eukprot:262686-Chlamydomonas_euryale.AAC.8